jgi:uncharacterized protein
MRLGPSLLMLCLLALSLTTGCNQKSRPTDPVVEAARSQIGVTVEYNPAYEKLTYPGGDVPRQRGVCTDVVIRALRDARGFDLQQLVHEDMKANFGLYPNLWDLKSTDSNLQTYFKRMGWDMKISSDQDDYQPNDLVTCKVDSGRPHIMLVSDRCNSKGTPLIIHNLGSGTQEQDALFRWKLTGHFRLPASGAGH